MLKYRISLDIQLVIGVQTLTEMFGCHHSKQIQASVLMFLGLCVVSLTMLEEVAKWLVFEEFKCQIEINIKKQNNQMSEQNNYGSTNFRSSAYSSRRGPSSQYEQPAIREYSADYSKYQRVTSQHSLKNQRKHLQHQPTTQDPNRLPTRRQNYVINNLRNQLQNIKSEVAKLISHDSPIKMRFSEETGSNEKTAQNYPQPKPQRFVDNSSTSSFLLSRSRPKARLPTQGLDKQRYHQLENQIIKNQLKNLKNKYVLRKNQYKEQKLTLEKKIQLLEGVIAHNQEEMAMYKSEIENEIINIREDMAGRISMGGDQGYAQNPRMGVLESENGEMRQEIVYLRKRIGEANEEIKKMAIQNHDLRNEGKREKARDGQIDLFKEKERENNSITQLKNQHSSRVSQLERVISQKQGYIQQILEKQAIANEVVMKNAELIDALNTERVKYSQLQTEYLKVRTQLQLIPHSKSELELESQLTSINPNGQSELEVKYNEIVHECNRLRQQNEILQRDLLEIGHLLNHSKMENQQLRSRIQQGSQIQSGRPCDISQDKSQMHKLILINQQLQAESNQIKGYINGMVAETAQKLNSMEIQNGIFRDKVIALESQNRGLRSGRITATKPEEPPLIQRMSSSEDNEKKTRRLEELQSWKITLEQTIEAKDREIESLRHEVKKFSQVYSKKCKQVEELHSHYSKQFEKESGKQSYLNSMIGNVTAKLEEMTVTSSKTIAELRQQIEIISSGQSPEGEIAQLRESINSLSEEAERLRQNCVTYHFALDTSKTTLEAEKAKFSLEIKSVEDSFEQEMGSLRGELNLTTRTADSLYSKVQTLSDELRKKDEFLNEFVVENFDRGDTERIQEMIASYTKASATEGIKKSLGIEVAEIQRLTNDNLSLMRQFIKLEEKVKWDVGEEARNAIHKE